MSSNLGTSADLVRPSQSHSNSGTASKAPSNSGPASNAPSNSGSTPHARVNSGSSSNAPSNAGSTSSTRLNKGSDSISLLRANNGSTHSRHDSLVGSYIFQEVQPHVRRNTVSVLEDNNLVERLILVHHITSMQRTHQYGVGGSTAYPVETVIFNFYQVECFRCGQSFANQAKLDAHRAARSYFCRRCRKDSKLFCALGRNPKPSKTYCNIAVGGCVQHQKCFTTEEKMFAHHEKEYHTRCYYETCDSKFRTRKQNDAQEVREHIASAHLED